MPFRLSSDLARAAYALIRRHVVAGLVFSALINLLYIAPTLYMLQVYERVVPTQGHRTLLVLTVVLAFALAVLAYLDRARSRLLVRASVALDTALAPIVLDRSLARSGDVEARQAMREFDSLRQTVTGPAMMGLLDLPWTPLYVIACFLLHPLIGLMCLAAIVLLPVLAWRGERATGALMSDAQRVAATAYASQEAVFAQGEAVRALGMRRNMVARQVAHRAAMIGNQTEASFLGGRYLTWTKFVRLLLQSLALGLGALLAIDHKISGGAIFAASFLIARALAPIEQVTAAWKAISQAQHSHGVVARVVGTLEVPAPPTRLPAPDGVVTVEAVTVAGAARQAPILDEVSFVAHPGEVVAIVGPSGAGKSTLARVLAGGLRPQSGSVRVDGADIEAWDAERLARHVGYMPQDPSLFAGSIRDNIARFDEAKDGNREAIDDEVVAAARAVSAHNLIVRLPGAYDYQLGLGGRGLSAGQAQRVALARAFYCGPQILVLDEPNAHLDNEGDAALLKAIGDAKAEGATVLLVSHKLSILPVVDKLLVLREGRVDMFAERDRVLARLRGPAPAHASMTPPRAANA